MSLIDADEIKKREQDVVLANGAKHRCFDTTMLFEIPTVDAVEVVRCKDCKWWYSCTGFCSDNGGYWRSSNFCSYGERREDAE